MTIRNYCIVIIGQTNGVEAEITKISETQPNLFDAKGLFIATFTSFLEPVEVTEWFVECNRNFMVFDLNEQNSGYNITNKAIHNGLFGFVNDINIEAINKSFMDTIDVTNHQENESITDRLDSNKIEKMDKEERQTLLDNLIDFGIEKLSEEEKKLLPLLAK